MSAAEILGKPLCALAFCWRLERRDGVTIGLTSHDRALTIDGLIYAATPGITPSAILRGGGEQELTELLGAISSAAISEADLDAGRWDEAMLLLHLTEWTDPGWSWRVVSSAASSAAVQPIRWACVRGSRTCWNARWRP